jgi:hypothetical protein
MLVTLFHQTNKPIKSFVMKNLLLIPILAILLSSCSKTDTTSDPLADLSAKTNIVVQSDWKITQYTDSGTDETSSFSAYRFKFNLDGTFIASSATETFNGTWLLAQGNTSPDDSGNNSADDKLNKLTISISGNKLMDKLNHKWLTDQITSSEIWLRDDNIASNEILRFGK